VRRKGEKPVVCEPLIWSETGTIAASIKTGDRWLYAWMMQQCVPMQKLARLSGINGDRLEELWSGADPTDEELEALAVPLRTDAVSLQASTRWP
jgi:hypothetical protein